MTPKFYILCGNTTHNRGDRINLMSQIRLLKQRYPDADITSDSFNPERDASWYGIRMIRRSSVFLSAEQIKYIKRADCVIWGGGAILADNCCRLMIPYWMCVIVFSKIILRKKIFAWAQGVVLETYTGRVFAGLTMKFADFITVRDEKSFNLLKLSGVQRKIHRTADPAILYEPEPKASGNQILSEICGLNNNRPIIGFGFTFWPFYSQPKDIFPFMLSARYIKRPMHDLKKLELYLDRVVELALRMIEEHDCNILFIPKYTASPWKDTELIAGMIKRISRPDRCFVIEGDSLPPDKFFSIWRCFEAQIGSSLHDGILSTALDVPCFNIFYESKGEEFFKQIGSLDRTMSLDCFLLQGGADDVASAAKKTMTEWNQKKNQYLLNKKRVSDQAMKNLDLLDEFIQKQIREK